MPIDVGPKVNGNIIVEDRGDGRLTSRVLPPGDERITSETTYTSHFATCPDGDQWRMRTHA